MVFARRAYPGLDISGATAEGAFLHRLTRNNRNPDFRISRKETFWAGDWNLPVGVVPKTAQAAPRPGCKRTEIHLEA
jgi:hypothetical protein